MKFVVGEKVDGSNKGGSTAPLGEDTLPVYLTLEEGTAVINGVWWRWMVSARLAETSSRRR